MSYNIKPLQYTKAQKLGVIIKPSRAKSKKIDVFKNGVKVASIGTIGYKDYATYIQLKGKDFADKKRKAYYARHTNPDTKDGIKTPSYWAKQILW